MAESSQPKKPKKPKKPDEPGEKKPSARSERTDRRKEKFYLRPEVEGHRFRFKLRAIIDATGLSVLDFAERHGWNDRVLAAWRLRNYLAGIDVPEIDALFRMARAFGVDPMWLADDNAPDAVSMAAERSIIEKSRTLGLEGAAAILEVSEVLGKNEALARLAAREIKYLERLERPIQEGPRHGQEIIVSDDDATDPPSGDHLAPEKHPRKKDK